MRVTNPPSKGYTPGLGSGDLGFDFGSIFAQVAPAAMQLYGNKQQIDMQKLQAKQQMQQAQQMALMNAQQYQQPTQNYGPSNIGGSYGGMPKWAIPAAVGAAGLLLVLTLRR